MGSARCATTAVLPVAETRAGPEGPPVVISLQVYVEHDDLALGHTISSLPDVDIGVVSDAGTDPAHDVYFFWIEADDYDAVESTLDADPTVASYEVIIEAPDRRTYGIEYTDEARLITPSITAMGGLVIESKSHANGWLLTLQLEDQNMLATFNEFVSDAPFRFDVFELQRGDAPDEPQDFGLTESQIEALVCAYVHGYYDEPRQISLEELGQILDISETAVSGRLRRGSARLIEAVLSDSE